MRKRLHGVVVAGAAGAVIVALSCAMGPLSAQAPAPRQFLYVSNSNPPNNLDYDGEIIKMSLDGRIVGKFGRAGKLLKEFGTVNSLDCRAENELLVGELGNWRVQKVTLKPAAGTQ